MRLDSNVSATTDLRAAGVAWWLDRHAYAMLIAVAAGAAVGSALPFVLTAAVSFGFYWRRSGIPLRPGAPFPGWANTLTAFRLVLVLSAAAVMTRIPAWLVLLAFAVNVALDVADGRVARRSGQSTEFGAILDRETDALFVLAAYHYFFLTEDVGVWVLAPGVLPYLCRVTARALRAPLSEARQPLAAALAGVNYVILLAAVAAPWSVALGLLAASAAVVALSFAASCRKLYRNGYSVSKSRPA